MPSVAEKRAAFRALHQSGCFVVANAWDAGSAVLLQSAGMRALASTSAGMAWGWGRPDGRVALEEVLDHLRSLSAAVDIPVNADFENGFAHDPDGVAINVRRAADSGVAGLSIEDATQEADNPLYDFEMAVERISAAASALAGTGVVLTARSEGFIRGRPDLDETIRRLQAYAEAGADCLFAPGLREESQIAAVVQAVAPKPVNILTPGFTMSQLEGLGVRRISVGGGLASVAYGAMLATARKIVAEGDFSGLAAGAPGRELNALFQAGLRPPA